jgi:hypothetical protein
LSERRFALRDEFVRNEGFGDLYLYDMDATRHAECQPDWQCLLLPRPRVQPRRWLHRFCIPDIGLGENSSTLLYYISVGSIGTGMQHTPIPLPENFFTNQKDSPQPALRPASPTP